MHITEKKARRLREKLQERVSQRDEAADEKSVALHSAAYHMYRSGKFEESAKLYRLLTALDPFRREFWTSLGASLQMSGAYENAQHAYAFALSLQWDDALTHFHSAECALSLKDLETAFCHLEYSKAMLTPKMLRLKTRIETLESQWNRHEKNAK